MARSNLLKDTVSGQVDLENILLRLKVILSDLEDENILGWIEGELRGYDKDDVIPDYRIIKGRPIGTFVVNQAYQYTNALVPLHFTAVSKDTIDKMLILNHGDGISVIEKNLKSENKHKLGSPIPTEYCHGISTPNLQIISMSIMYSSNDFEAILSNVKDKVVDIIMMLEKKFGPIAIDEMDISDQMIEEPEKRNEAITYINNLVYNDTSTSVEMGDKNKLKNAKVGKFFRREK